MITKVQAKVLLRAATSLSKVTGKDAKESLLVIVKSIATEVKIRNKG